MAAMAVAQTTAVISGSVKMPAVLLEKKGETLLKKIKEAYSTSVG
jgi:hypothetical protein